MPTKNLQKVKTPYDILLSKVRSTLLEGQRRIEEEKVRTYWQTGAHIHKHILKYADRADYGGQIINRLVVDLKVDKSTLHETVMFAKAYPDFSIVSGRSQLKWTHFRELVRIADVKLRMSLEEKTQRNAWTADELIARIKSQKPQPLKQSPKLQGSSQELLKPLRGELYHYKIIRRPDVNPGPEDSGLRLDLGFRNLQKLSAKTAAQFEVGDIVTSYPKDGGYRFTKVSGAGESILFTYEAIVENVIDGDTLKVRFDQCFNFERIETLRLRGIDCPEIDTPAGVAAKNFVLSYIKQSDKIIVRSSRPEKYDRYVADVFIPPREATKDIFLNNLLLETGHAVRM